MIFPSKKKISEEKGSAPGIPGTRVLPNGSLGHLGPAACSHRLG